MPSGRIRHAGCRGVANLHWSPALGHSGIRSVATQGCVRVGLAPNAVVDVRVGGSRVGGRFGVGLREKGFERVGVLSIAPVRGWSGAATDTRRVREVRAAASWPVDPIVPTVR